MAMLTMQVLSAPVVLRRLLNRGHDVNTIIDVGASDGEWSIAASSVFPRARYLLIEANKQFEPALARHHAKSPRQIDYVMAAAADRCGEVDFIFTEDPKGGAIADGALPDPRVRSVPCVTIDGQ